MSNYLVSMGDKGYVVEINSDGLISVEGYKGSINVQPFGRDTYSVLLDNLSTQVTAQRIGEAYQVLVNNIQDEVIVETERDRLLRQYATASISSHQRYEIHAPMPALVVKLEVQVGDEVKGGQGLIILEAMKMENEIKSHRAGRVKEIYVAKGKAVEKGELLMLLE